MMIFALAALVFFVVAFVAGVKGFADLRHLLHGMRAGKGKPGS